ncbi:MAG TPA: sigma-70 family RNA polymerase sigma factor [Candidatus Nanoarchaeia archaeon]|nr:sigma-70 family RNA polymerase sigma factor [Candidatus Nanoarchaeia archaeon]
MAKNYHSKQQLNQLGQEYSVLVQQGYGTTAEQRTPRQKEIAQQIIGGTQRLLYHLARRIIQGQGYTISASQGKKVTLKVKDPRIGSFYRGTKAFEKELSLDDLVNVAAVTIIERLHKYQPAKSSVVNFVCYNAAATIYREAHQKLGLVRIPVHKQEQIRKYLLQHNLQDGSDGSFSRNKLISRLSSRDNGLRIGTRQAALIYLALTGDYAPLDEPAPDYKKNNTPADEKLESRIRDKTVIDPVDEIARKELAEKTFQLLSTFTEREQKVLNQRFGIGTGDDKDLDEVAKENDVTRERIRQIEAKALGKLRHPSRSDILEKFIE